MFGFTSAKPPARSAPWCVIPPAPATKAWRDLGASDLALRVARWAGAPKTAPAGANEKEPAA
jgi:hypothetical protein